MVDTSHSPIGWEQVARAVQGGLAVQRESTLVYASSTFASLVGTTAERLTGTEWRTLVDSAESERPIRDALVAARTDGDWTGSLRFDMEPDGRALDVTLSTLPGDTHVVLWVIQGTGNEAASDDHVTMGSRTVPPPVSLTLARTVFDSIDDVVYVIDDDGEFKYWNDQLVETTGYSHEEIQSMHPSEFIPPDQHEYVPGLMDAIEDIRDRRVEVDILTKDGERIAHEFSGTTFEEPETNRVYRCGIARDITDRLEREAELARQRDNLATLNRINDLLFETARELIQTGSRDAVEETICERLASSELYDSVWIVERALDGDGFVTRVEAGVGGSPEPDIFEGSDANPVSTAIQRGTVEVATSSARAVDAWNAATDGPDAASFIAVPLQHGETVYGVLVLTTAREDAFGSREQAGFEVLGQLIGVVVHAARSRELLFADTVVELEFGFSESELPFVDAARALDCRLTLDGYAPAKEGWVMYLTVEGAPAAVVAELSGHERIAHARAISGSDSAGRLEVGVTTVSVLQVVSDAGATVQTASVTPESARFVVETAIDTDVRQVVDEVTDAFPGATLLASRKRDREITTVGWPGGILDELTDRQREVLEAAYQAGYFDWPRESTAEEVADSLGLTSPTLHGHLRKAESIILSGLLDES